MACSLEELDCSICLQTLNEPVTTACGHTYCMKCINKFWNVRNNRRGTYSCPQCQETFRTRPNLKKNTVLANLLEEHKKKTTESAAADEDEDSYAGLGDVQCDACTNRKRKAQVFCVVCLASYCQSHIQPHFDVPPLKKHRLIQASTRIKEKICSRHNKLLEIYCRTDQQLLCPLCVVEHKAHDIVTDEAEFHAKKEEVEMVRQEVSVRKTVSESKIAQLKDAAGAIRDAAWEVCDDFERQCKKQITLYARFMEKKCSEMREKAGELEKAGVDWTKRSIGELEREVFKLRGMDNKLRLLSETEDTTEFLQEFQVLGNLPVLTDAPERLDLLEEFVSAQKDKLKQMSDKQKNESFSNFHELQITVPRRLRHKLTRNTKKMEIKSRKDISARCRHIKLEVNPDTVPTCLFLSKTKKEILWSSKDQAHPDHPDRFTHLYQVLCQQGLREDCFWEVMWDGGIIEVAVSYIMIARKGLCKKSCFGHNNISWKLICSPSGCTFWHNNLHKSQIPPASSRRVCVHLQYERGRLSFYSVSDRDRLTLLHEIQTTFTGAIYPGFSVDLGATLKICDI